jgi:hypothetical protein
VNERKRRIGENEAVFRSVNEQIQGLSRTLTAATETMSLVCECGTRSCADRFQVRPADYVEVRDDATLFLIKPGHDFPETETVIERTDAYWVVRKDPGEPAELAREASLSG